MKFLIGKEKNYKWGKIGKNSFVAKFVPLEKFDPFLPYAEFWLGTHPNGMATLKENKSPLDSEIGQDLGFLFKVLSAETSLSIQCHPSKDFAEKLHLEQPQIYKDPNHKPELCYALSDFSMLLGFRENFEIIDLLKNFPELDYFLGFEKIPTTKQIFEKYLRTPKTTFIPLLNKLTTRLKLKSKPKPHPKSKSNLTLNPNLTLIIKKIEKLMLKLSSQFPNDIGIIAPIFFNIINLTPEQAVFIPPGIPHSYIHGDCFECMASSDNVIRCGLTFKHKDVETLLKALDFEHFKAEISVGEDLDDFRKGFGSGNERFKEFYFEKIDLKDLDGGKMYELVGRDSFSVCLVYEGSGFVENGVGRVRLEMGDGFLIAPWEIVKLSGKCLKIGRCSKG